MNQKIWQDPTIVIWSQLLLDSYDHLLGHQLIERKNAPVTEAKDLFFAPFVVVSHGTQSDPIFNYANQTALNLWEMNWQTFTQTPSRYSAEADQRDKREEMLQMAQKQGYINNYQGIRISQTGKRFQIDRAIIWNVFDENQNKVVQAATFSQWILINS